MSNDLPPRREFLVDQVATVLRREIGAGRWREWLPGERVLCKVFNVSRLTLRVALRQLVSARELTLFPRLGYRVGPREAQPPKRTVLAPEIGLICPERIYSMPSQVIQLVDLLRSMCAEGNLHLEIFEGRRFAPVAPGRFMAQMTRNHPKACWIAIMADRRMQQWFARTGTPAVLYGNVYPDLRLPGAGIDYRVCIRHATTTLLTKGHRRVALVTYDPRRAGEQESIAGFHEAFRSCKDAEAAGAIVVARPDDDVDALRRQVDRLLEAGQPPTAFIVCRTHHYATVATRVLESGRRIPADVSLICRGDDPFLHFLLPSPAHYQVNLELLARMLFRCLLRVVGGATRPDERHRVVPEYVMGASVGPMRSERKK